MVLAWTVLVHGVSAQVFGIDTSNDAASPAFWRTTTRPQIGRTDTTER